MKREKSSKSSTILESLSDSFSIIERPSSISSSFSNESFKTTAHPLMDVSGVLSSWEIEDIKSFLILSLFTISSASAFKASASDSISSPVLIFARDLYWPSMYREAIVVNSLIGFTIVSAI